MLAAYLIDGDQLDITGFSGPHGLWRVLAPAMPPIDSRLFEHFADEPPPADHVEPTEATAAALAWASAAGKSGNRTALHHLFAEVDEGIFGGERAIGWLLPGLGFAPVR